MMRRLLPQLTAGLMCALVTASISIAPRHAQAQEDTGDETFLSSSSTSTTTSAVTTGLIVLTVVTVTPDPQAQALRYYLQSNPAEVRMALASGAGPAVTDLAGAFGVRALDHDAFGRALRRRRAALARPFDDGHVTLDETRAFVRTIQQAMLEDPRLRQAVRALEG